MAAWENAPVADSAPAKQPAWASAPQENKSAASSDYSPESPPVMARVGRGMMDVAQGLKQLWLMGTNPEEAKKYTQEVNDEIALYEKGRGKDAGTDWARIGGNVAFTAPAMLVPGANAATLGARVASSAAGGALANGSMFSDEASLGSKAGQAAVGAMVGGAVPVAINGAIKAGSGIINAVGDAAAKTIRAATGQASPTQVNITLQQTLASRGIDLSKLSQEAQGALLADVRDTLQAGAAVNADAIERKAALLAVGAKPTQGMVTRDPVRWGFERNTADIQGAGDRLKARFVGNNQAFNEFGEAIKRGTGGTAPDAYEASASALQGLKSADASRKAAVDAAYDGARNTQGRYVALDHVGFVNQANDALDQGMLGHYLPSQVRNLLNDVSTGKLPLNVNTATQLDSVLSAAQRGGNAAEAKAIGVVRDALGNAPAADAMGDASRAAFDTARGLARDRFANIEKIPALKAALDGVEPDQFFGKFVLRGNAKELESLGGELSKADPAAWNNIRSQTVNWLISKATNGKGADGTFSGSGLRTALESLGPQRLNALFKPEEVAQIQTLAKAARAGTETPAFTKASIGSNTAEKLTNLLNKAGNLPYLKDFVVQPMKNFHQSNQVSQALTGAQVTPISSIPPLVGNQAQTAMAQRAGRLGVPLSVLINGMANQ